MAKKEKQRERNHFLFTRDNPKSIVAEAYRTLRTNMGFTEMDRPCRTILFTSSHPKEGKSTTAANTALVMAQAGNKVLLVDCDLRKPVQHQVFNVSNQVGLTNCLTQKAVIQDVIHTGLADNFTLMTSGPIPPNPAEILGSEHTKAFWKKLAEQYDYVFIDSPPVLAVTDAAILSTQVDGVVMVVAANFTRIDHAQDAKEQLIKANAHIIGVVINKVKMTKGRYQYYYYSSDAS